MLDSANGPYLQILRPNLKLQQTQVLLLCIALYCYKEQQGYSALRDNQVDLFLIFLIEFPWLLNTMTLLWHSRRVYRKAHQEYVVNSHIPDVLFPKFFPGLL